MKKTTPALLIGLLAVAASATAKLPAPSDDAKAKAAEAAAKTAHTAKVDGYKLCLSMDRVATTYQSNAKKAGMAASAPVATPPCADPGPFVYTPPAPASAPTITAAAAAPAPVAPVASVPTAAPASAAKK